ncbi:MAG: hypothetical protein FWB73_04695 [Treponema sp.]|nr:hypothetical protein [Treponema sp.]
MRKFISICVLILFITSGLSAQITVSGILDTTISGKAGAGDSPAFSFGFEEYANIRFQARMREMAVIHAAVNLIAAAGDFAADAAMLASQRIGLPLGLTAFISGDNYLAAIELERLYFRLRTTHIDIDSGLFRIPFGYGQMWGPSDFLNPRNPLKPDARPRGVLGATLTWFPIDELKLLWFYAAPINALTREGMGSLVGISMDKHWDKASLQVLYSYETPITNSTPPLIDSSFGKHRAGISVKADVEVGLVMEALYTYNHEERTDHEGLSVSAGIDYSFFDGKFMILAEYLYNGKKSSTALGYGGSFSNNHYLYTGFTFKFNDFINMTAALLSGFDDISFTPIISFNYELFQGATLIITAQVPLDRDLFHQNGKRGELGPLAPDMTLGSYFICNVKLRLRF